MNRKRAALVIAAASMALTVMMLVGCSGSSAQDGSGAGGDGATTLSVGFDQSYPPYGFVGDDGKFTGFDLDLAKAVCDKNGWKLKLDPIDWDAKDALLDSGAINCIWNGFTMEGRENDYTFSEPYMLNKQVVVVKAGSSIKDLDDLAGKTVMTQADSAALAVLKKPSDKGGKADLAATFKDLQTIGDYNSAFMQLQSGMVDAVACDLSVAAYQMAAKPNVYRQLEPLSTEHYAVGFKKGNTDLAQKVTATLKELDKDGTVKQLCDKYAKDGITYENWVLK